MSYLWMWMDTGMFFDLPKEQRHAVRAWLKEHDLRFVKDWVVHDGKLTATKYKVNEDDDRYVVNCQGKTRAEDPHHPRHSDGWSCWHGAQEEVTVALKSPPPVTGVV